VLGLRNIRAASCLKTFGRRQLPKQATMHKQLAPYLLQPAILHCWFGLLVSVMLAQFDAAFYLHFPPSALPCRSCRRALLQERSARNPACNQCCILLRLGKMVRTLIMLTQRDAAVHLLFPVSAIPHPLCRNAAPF
jgi:hypothetical protein